jgi:hypothetical protein
MVFAFHTIEGYVNFIGERIAPEIWQDEEKYFKNCPTVAGRASFVSWWSLQVCRGCRKKGRLKEFLN